MLSKLYFQNRALLLLLSIICSNAYAACHTKHLDQVFSLMAQRNSQMKNVAAIKYITGKNIYDANQELTVLQNSQQIATKLKLNPSQLMIYTQLQMDNSKQIQNYWLSYWKSHPKEAPNAQSVPSLELTRQQISTIDNQIYPLIKANVNNILQCNQNTLNTHYKKAMKSVEGIPQSPDYNMLLINALQNISRQDATQIYL